MTRSESREALFLLLFEASFYETPDAEEIKSLAAEYRELETNDYINDLFEKILASIQSVDMIIEPNLQKVSLNRLSRVARTALRIAVYEAENTDTPDAVVINEAVNLVKKYDTDEVAKYVNGVLGSYVRSKA